jgi:hypothetical protein
MSFRTWSVEPEAELLPTPDVLEEVPACAPTEPVAPVWSALPVVLELGVELLLAPGVELVDDCEPVLPVAELWSELPVELDVEFGEVELLLPMAPVVDPVEDCEPMLEVDPLVCGALLALESGVAVLPVLPVAVWLDCEDDALFG